jgi:carbon-monoxide dehydrogenase medium subunit
MYGINKFEYIAPNKIIEAVKILKDIGSDSVIMAGGTDLLIKIKKKIIKPKFILGLKNINELKKIYLNKKKELIIGSNILLSTISELKKIIKKYPTIASSAKITANTQIRNMGTIVGNLCNASPSADNAPILLAMKSKLNIINYKSNKIIKLKNFFLGPGKTILKKNEIVKSIIVPKLHKNYGSSYISISQKGKQGCTSVSSATVLNINKKKIIEDITIFIGACAPTPIRAFKTENLLKKNKINNKIINEASKRALKEISPISDIRSSKEYRNAILPTIVKRSIKEAINMSNFKIFNKK